MYNEYSFKNYYCGKINSLTVKILTNLSENILNKKSISSSIFIITGNPNTGKTHLSYALHNSIKDTQKSFIISSREFMNYYITSLVSNTKDKFDTQINYNDIIILEDIDYLYKKSAILDKLTEIIINFKKKGKIVILSVKNRNFVQSRQKI